jgi:hypothetical protein
MENKNHIFICVCGLIYDCIGEVISGANYDNEIWRWDKRTRNKNKQDRKENFCCTSLVMLSKK